MGPPGGGRPRNTPAEQRPSPPIHSGVPSSSHGQTFSSQQPNSGATQLPLHSSTPNRVPPSSPHVNVNVESSTQLDLPQQQIHQQQLQEQQPPTQQQQPSTRRRIPAQNTTQTQEFTSSNVGPQQFQPPQNEHLNHNTRQALPQHQQNLHQENDRPGPSHQDEDGPLDENDGPPGFRSNTNIRVDISSKQEVCDSTPVILSSFIADRMAYDGYTVPQNLRNLPKKESAIAGVLRQMGDDISKNYKLNHLISEIQVTPNTAYKTFASVASQIFVDGSINWGRVVMLFYFAYKLALQVLNQIPLIDIIIGWVTRFVSDRISTWISNQGGWNAIREYYGSSTGQMVGVFLAGILVSTLFWYWRK